MVTMYTVARIALIREADRIEQYAEQSLSAWILLGQAERYGRDMHLARQIRRAAAERSPAVRREIMRNLGYVVAKI